MSAQRWRPALWALLALVVLWTFVVVAFRVAKASMVTAEKVEAFIHSVDFGSLKGEARAKALRDLAAKLNKLTPDERRKLRLGRVPIAWFEQMEEAEKIWFVEATMPNGFKQMLTSFEQLPEDRRKRTIDDAIRRLRQTRDSPDQEQPSRGTNDPVISPELEAKIRNIGLKTFYSESSAQTKAELAPLLEELQLSMESGRPFRRP